MGSPSNGEAVPVDGSEDPGWLNQEMFGTRAMGAATAAYQAEMANKHCVALAVWVQHLWQQVQLLQGKVVELEDWKRKALDDVRKLREDQKELKLQVCDAAHEGSGLPQKAVTLPAQGIQNPGPPPGLSTPPGMREDSVASSSFGNASEPTSGYISSSLTAAEADGQLEGIQVTEGEVEGQPCEIAEWRIGHLSSKLKGCMGKALVSPPFAAAGLEDVRLMVFPDGKDAAKGPRSKRQKELYAKKVSEGPLDGCLKMKFVPEEGSRVLEYYLSVGSERRGPFKHDFGEKNINGCDDFEVDWLAQLDQDLSLTLRVQILKA